jgi:hypothetical protein
MAEAGAPRGGRILRCDGGQSDRAYHGERQNVERRHRDDLFRLFKNHTRRCRPRRAQHCDRNGFERRRPFRFLPAAILPVFFALSGFLVSGSLERTALHQFITLRVLRLMPALAVPHFCSAAFHSIIILRIPDKSSFLHLFLQYCRVYSLFSAWCIREQPSWRIY